jgi:hypothetical protein
MKNTFNNTNIVLVFRIRGIVTPGSAFGRLSVVSG